MSLASLRSYDRETAAKILASAAFLAAPSPGTEASAFQDAFIAPANAVIEELQRQIQVSSKSSRARKTTISAAISREIQALFAVDKTADAALDRAGQAGRLVPSMYKVVQPKPFRQQFARFGLKRSDVERSVRYPDDFQHLMSDVTTDKSREDLSLFMKSMKPMGSDGEEEFWLLVQCVRLGVSQTATSAWKVYASEVDFSSAETPLDVLKSFVEVYGIPFFLEGIRSKFVERIEIPAVNGKGSFTIDTEIPAYKSALAQISYNASIDPNKANVGIGYVIDMDRYAMAMAQHA